MRRIKVLIGTSSGPLLVEDNESHPQGRSSPGRSAPNMSIDCVSGLTCMSMVTFVRQAVWRDEAIALRPNDCLQSPGKQVHVVGVSTASEVELLHSHKDIATFEITPHYLTFAASHYYERPGTLIQINPPIREASHRDPLWRGVMDCTARLEQSAGRFPDKSPRRE
jgi:dihydroorotase